MCGKFHTPLEMVRAWVAIFVQNIIGVEFGNRWTDRQTNSLTPYTGVCGFFLSVKFATSLTRFARRGITPSIQAAL